MDKKRLNNEIILCRPAVRKARVAVIRKILKKMKILRDCKVESLKEKKLKKSERLFKKVKILKKVKEDDVTKFALRHSDLETLMAKPKQNVKKRAIACLARHKAIATKINAIREEIPDWETQLPLLLDSLGKKKKRKLEGKQETTETDTKIQSNEVKEKNYRSLARGETRKQNKEVINSEDKNTIEHIKVQKIDDPFFIEKKVVAPKLVLESSSSEISKRNFLKVKKLEKPKWESNSSMFHTKPFKTKNDRDKYKVQEKTKPEPEEEKLHPSWAAKKVKLIKPFQGKKITFTQD